MSISNGRQITCEMCKKTTFVDDYEWRKLSSNCGNPLAAGWLLVGSTEYEYHITPLCSETCGVAWIRKEFAAIKAAAAKK